MLVYQRVSIENPNYVSWPWHDPLELAGAEETVRSVVPASVATEKPRSIQQEKAWSEHDQTWNRQHLWIRHN